MDPPLYNSNETNQNLNNNYDQNQYNQYQGPNLGQENQLYMIPPNMNPPPLEQQNPNLDMYEKPYYSPQNPTQTPINSQQNQPISSPSQVYYSPPQIDQNPQSQPQPFSQGVPLVQQMNYPIQNSGIIQTQGISQINYQNYQNISQVSNKGIIQKDKNTFIISSGYQGKFLPLCLIIFGIIFILFGIVSIAFDAFIVIICGLVFLIIGIMLCNHKKIYFIIGPNNLTVINKTNCSKKVYAYNPGQLLRVDFIYNLGINIVANSNHKYNYILNIVLSNGQVVNIFTSTSNVPKFTLEEINYFLYFINNHIQNNMKI